jgi:hypothetical protein
MSINRKPNPTANAAHLAKISSVASRRLGGIHSIHNRGFHKVPKDGCKFCETDQDVQGAPLYEQEHLTR